MKNFIRKAARQGVKEALFLIHDKKALLVFVILPAMWLILYFGMFSRGLMTELPFGIVNPDQSALTEEIESRITAIPSLKAFHYPDTTSALKAARAGDILGFMAFDAQFTKRFGTAQTQPIELYFDRNLYPASVTLELDIKAAIIDFVYDIWEGVAQTAGTSGAQARDAARLITVNNVTIGNIAFNYLTYLIGTLVAGILQLLCALAVVTSIVREKLTGNWQAWLAESGVAAGVAGKIVFYAGLYLIFAFLFIIYVAGYQGFVHVTTPVFLWIATYALFFIVLGCAAFAATFVIIRVTPVFAWVGVVVYCAPIYPFTGFSFPAESMDVTARVFGQCLPLTHFIRAQGSLWFLGETGGLYSSAIVALVTFAIVFIAIGTLAFKAFDLEHRL